METGISPERTGFSQFDIHSDFQRPSPCAVIYDSPPEYIFNYDNNVSTIYARQQFIN
jgi:hypothetical protein